MTRPLFWTLSIAVLLLAPAGAAAREPIISYVDATGTFRLWDEELNAEVTPPPAVPAPANFLGFRYGMSLNGRYIVFNDDPAPRKLHLLDRATNTEVPLPGIDVYASPGAPTVSDGGLIAFDDNGNGPALVYNSATGQFVDSGLAANNGHRQTRLSGDGRFLGTTCNDSNCVDDLDNGADPYVQDLGTRLDTGFPNDPNFDEEHPCIDADGSLFGFDKRVANAQPFDVYLFDRSVSPPQAVALPGANDPLKDETNCVLDATGEFVGLVYDQANDATFRVYHRPTATFLNLPPDKEFNSRSMFSAPYVTDPAVRRFRMTRRRFRPGRRATAFRYVLSEPADVRIVIRRRGRRVGTIARADRPAGANSIGFSGRFRRRALSPGRYLAVLTATDDAGNSSAPKRIRFRVLRRPRAS